MSAVVVPGYELGEEINASATTVVHRARRRSDGREIVIKTLSDRYPRSEDIAELRREYSLLTRLDPVDGIVRALALEPLEHGNCALVMERAGITLSSQLSGGRPMPLDRFFSLAVPLARVLADLHDHGVVHKDVVPSNVLLDDEHVVLVDFSLASELSSEFQSASLSNRFEGSFPYMSPEQTGRMSRGVDQRSDLYSFGVTCFQMLTGELPFSADRPLEWAHRHIASPAPRADEVDASVPAALADIIEVLLRKNPDDRYQSAHGVLADLERCAAQQADTGIVAEFPLRQHDHPNQFWVPNRLFGRTEPMSALAGAYELADGGASELFVVSGESGIGKTALVNELAQQLARTGGSIGRGKFDQFGGEASYAAIGSAFGQIVSELIVEEPDWFDEWRTQLVDALRGNGQVIIDVIPELAAVLGEQPEAADLPPVEASNRFQIAFSAFAQSFGEHGRTVVVFLDDLQWSDQPTLHLIEHLMSSRDLRQFLLIGAYRSNEVDVGHPLRLALNELESHRNVEEIELGPLDLASVTEMVAATVRRPVDESTSLAELVHTTAEGNPFFIVQLLKHLHDEGALVFDRSRGWRWDVDEIRLAAVTTDVAEFMADRLRRLPQDCQDTLRLAACIGNRFDLETLSLIAKREPGRVADELKPAIVNGIVVPIDDDYRLVGQEFDDIAPVDDRADRRVLNPTYVFRHDRVQQAAYGLIDEGSRQSVHWSIGQRMVANATDDVLRQRLIAIVGHLNRGRSLATDPDQRLRLADLNLRAARQAVASSAYDAALELAQVGRELLGADAWVEQTDLMLQLAAELQQCEYLTGRHADAERRTDEMLAHARTPLETAQILAVRTRQFATLGRMRDSIQAAIAGLELLGMTFPAAPTQADVDREHREVDAALAGRSNAELLAAPDLDDPNDAVAITLLMEIFPAAFLSGSGNLFPFLVLRSVSTTLRRGNSPEAPFAYAAYGMLLCGALDQPRLGYRFGQLAVEMNERLANISLKSRVTYVYTMFIHHWNEHWSTMTPWFRQGIEYGYRSGDLLYLAYSAQDCIIWDPRLDLETAAQQHADYLRIVRECDYQDSFDSGSLFLQLQHNLLGRTDDPCSLSDDEFDEAAVLAGMHEREFMTGVANYHIYKTEAAAFHGRFDEALVHVRAQDELLDSVMSLPQLVRYMVASTITLGQLYDQLDDAERAAADQRFERDIDKMRMWADNCPENFRHLELTMRGIVAQVAGDDATARDHFEAASTAAEASGFLRDEGVANELIARNYLRAGRTRPAIGYLETALHCFRRWQAHRKVAMLLEEFPGLLVGRLTSTTPGRGGTGRVDNASLDLDSLVRASQAISGELVVDRLWATTLPLLVETSGAQRACFVTRRDDQLTVEYEHRIDHRDDGASGVPQSVVNHVLRTREPITANRPDDFGRFARDRYLVADPPSSFVCLPVTVEGHIECAIYLEHRSATDVFTENRIEVLQLLAAQAAISLENATLYDDQLRFSTAQSRFVPRQFLESLDRADITLVGLGDTVAREMSVLFADLRGFTSISEEMHPRDVIELLNRYFLRLEPAIIEAGGFIDSFRGDEIMALFDGGADAAVAAAIGMCNSLDRFNDEARADSDVELRVGVGINTGPLVLGTVGTPSRIQCSVIGDTVNAASRIEQLTKTYGARLLIGPRTYTRLERPQDHAIRLVDRVQVKGKTELLDIYEVLDTEPARRDAKSAAAEAIVAMLDTSLRLDERFATAQRLLAEFPEDPVVVHHHDRLQREHTAARAPHS